jgi:cytochrome c553
MKLIMSLLLIFSFNLFAQDVENGKKLYAKCTSCHGNDGMGKKSQKAPMLAGQHDWYLESQINAIKNKKRVSGSASKMYPFVKALTDNEIKDLSAYIATLPVVLN